MHELGEKEEDEVKETDSQQGRRDPCLEKRRKKARREKEVAVKFCVLPNCVLSSMTVCVIRSLPY